LKRCQETKKNLIDNSKNNSIMNSVNGIKMDTSTEPETITGKSYLKQQVETDTNIIKENKLTILNHIYALQEKNRYQNKKHRLQPGL